MEENPYQSPHVDSPAPPLAIWLGVPVWWYVTAVLHFALFGGLTIFHTHAWVFPLALGCSALAIVRRRLLRIQT